MGLGVSVIGLLVFPFSMVPARPSGGRLGGFSRARRYLKLARYISWPLGIFTALTLTGYVILYTEARGRFCSERFNANLSACVYIWAIVTIVTFTLLTLSAVLRLLSRNLDQGSGS